ncbi:class I SAM-dependent methyltransferase, partial [bacterium]|nr:class I SAM-dependent methyltransferase [bacterium]
MMIKQTVKTVFESLTHLVGRLTGRYYFEDYIRVYPDKVAFNRFGKQRAYSQNDYNNFLNHCKFYQFCGQFVKDKAVADIGCGSGYGCELLANSGAAKVCGCDVSHHALEYAKKHFGNRVEFSNQSITDLNQYADDSFDVVISSEVLEHIKEYNLEAA